MPVRKSRNSRNGGQRHRILELGFQKKISRGLQWEPAAEVPDCETETPHQTDAGNWNLGETAFWHQKIRSDTHLRFFCPLWRIGEFWIGPAVRRQRPYKAYTGRNRWMSSWHLQQVRTFESKQESCSPKQPTEGRKDVRQRWQTSRKTTAQIQKNVTSGKSKWPSLSKKPHAGVKQIPTRSGFIFAIEMPFLSCALFIRYQSQVVIG